MEPFKNLLNPALVLEAAVLLQRHADATGLAFDGERCAAHHVKADGSLSPKVFKGWTLELAPGATLTLTRQHALRPITTRRYHAGRHEIAVQVNGAEVDRGAFALALPRTGG